MNKIVLVLRHWEFGPYPYDPGGWAFLELYFPMKVWADGIKANIRRSCE